MADARTVEKIDTLQSQEEIDGWYIGAAIISRILDAEERARLEKRRMYLRRRDEK